MPDTFYNSRLVLLRDTLDALSGASHALERLAAMEAAGWVRLTDPDGLAALREGLESALERTELLASEALTYAH